MMVAFKSNMARKFSIIIIREGSEGEDNIFPITLLYFKFHTCTICTLTPAGVMTGSWVRVAVSYKKSTSRAKLFVNDNFRDEVLTTPGAFRHRQWPHSDGISLCGWPCSQVGNISDAHRHVSSGSNVKFPW